MPRVVITFLGGVGWLGESKAWAECEVGLFSLLHGCCHPVRDKVCSPVVGVDALRVRVNQAAFSLNGALPLEEATAEASEACVLTGPVHHPCRCLRLSSDAAQGLILSSVVFTPDLVQGCGLERWG